MDVDVDVLLYAQMFLQATERISRSNHPLLHEVIPLIDMLYDRLKIARDNSEHHAVVRAAAARGIVMLNKYYSATDESIMYRAAMSTSTAPYTFRVRN